MEAGVRGCWAVNVDAPWIQTEKQRMGKEVKKVQEHGLRAKQAFYMGTSSGRRGGAPEVQVRGCWGKRQGTTKPTRDVY